LAADDPAKPPAKKPDGTRLSTLEDRTKDADVRLARLEKNSANMREDVDMLAEATGGLRQQSAKMREAALRVAEAVTMAAKRREAKKPKGKRAQPDTRPPRT